MFKKALLVIAVISLFFTGFQYPLEDRKADAIGTSASVKSSYLVDVVQPSVTKQIKNGEKFIVALKENATTGYAWSYKISDSKGVVLYSEVALTADDTTGGLVMGAGTDKVWEFKALKTGKYTISFEYKRSFEKTAIEKLIYKVVIVK